MAKLDTLLSGMRKARESSIKIDRFTFTIRRPTDMDALGMNYSNPREAMEGITKFVVGWDGVTEMDLVPGGTGEAVMFHPALFAEWIQDQPDMWSNLTDKVLELYNAHTEKREKKGKA